MEGDFISVSLTRQILVKEEKHSKTVVEGKVTDEAGVPLVGVHVQITGDVRKGVITDVDGKFSLDLPADKKNRTIDFSFVGMHSEHRSVNCGGGNISIIVVLKEDNAKLGEVVVTGYQNIDRRHLTSAVSSVRMDDIRMPGVSNLTQMLEGKVPDMIVANNSGEVNATPRVRVRGTSTIIGNREPLWVVDGIIVNDPVNLSPDVLNDPDYVNRIGNAISGLNPQDIERLDVLKDAAATALYGTRAANGVIVVTTKKRKSR